MSPTLSVVTDNNLKTAFQMPETVAQKVRRLQAEARQLAKDHVKAFTDAMTDLESLAAEIAGGGEAYSPASATSPDAWPRTSTAASRRWRRSPRGDE